MWQSLFKVHFPLVQLSHCMIDPHLRLDLGDLYSEVDACCGPGNGFSASGNAPPDLVAILHGVLLLLLPQEVYAIQPAVLILPSLLQSKKQDPLSLLMLT